MINSALWTCSISNCVPRLSFVDCTIPYSLRVVVLCSKMCIKRYLRQQLVFSWGTHYLCIPITPHKRIFCEFLLSWYYCVVRRVKFSVRIASPSLSQHRTIYLIMGYFCVFFYTALLHICCLKLLKIPSHTTRLTPHICRTIAKSSKPSPWCTFFNYQKIKCKSPLGIHFVSVAVRGRYALQRVFPYLFNLSRAKKTFCRTFGSPSRVFVWNRHRRLLSAYWSALSYAERRQAPP